ncbi:MAG: glycosyltransferase family 39 protein [bacterium]|nr:glycosyltransferase family 39 protein [bacterium]
MNQIIILTRTKSIVFLIALGVCTFLYNLHIPVVREWDEATYGINAYEMAQTNNPFVVTFGQQSDVYNSKPPLGVWLMAISTKIFGVNTFSLRFASALLSLLFSICLFEFIFRQFKDLHWAFLSALILMSSIGFTGWHEARSGDFDAMVAIFISLFAFSSYLVLKNKNPQYWFLAALFLSAACLTKGVYGLVVIPGIGLFFLLQKQVKLALSHWQFYTACIGFLFLFLGYYFLREKLSPGYLQAVLQNEVGERVFLETNIHKNEIPFYYHSFKLLFYRFQPFILLIPFAVYGVWFEPNKAKQNFLWLICLSALSIWTIISFSKTKLVWYDGSLYPFFAILVAHFLAKQTWLSPPYLYALVFAIWLAVFGLNQNEKDSFSFPKSLEYARHEHSIAEPINVYSSNFEHPIRYYLLQDSLNGYQSRFITNLHYLQPNDLLMLRNKVYLDSLHQKFELVASNGEDILVRIVNQ